MNIFYVYGDMNDENFPTWLLRNINTNKLNIY